MGFIAALPYSFAPLDWLACEGQMVPLTQNQALFSLLGTTFGGNGQTTFGIPDLRGRTIVGTGQSTSGTLYTQGETGGVEQVTLNLTTLPTHTHVAAVGNVQAPVSGTITAVMNVNNTTGGGVNAQGNYLANQTSQGDQIYATTENGQLNASAIAVTPSLTANINGGAVTVQSTGQGLPHENRMPFLAINYCIATQGLYPQRP